MQLKKKLTNDANKCVLEATQIQNETKISSHFPVFAVNYPKIFAFFSEIVLPEIRETN